MSKSVLKQELFVISEHAQQEGIRQDQTSLEPGTTFLKLAGKSYQLLSMSCFDCTADINPTELKEFKAMILANPKLEADLICHGILVQRLPVKWMRPEKTIDEQTLLFFEVANEPFCIERVQSLHKTSKIIQEQSNYAHQLSTLPSAYKAVVYEFRDLLVNLKTKIDKMEADVPKDSFRDAQEYRLGVTQSVAQYLENLQIPKIYAEAAKHIKELSPEQIKLCMDFARSQVGPLVYGAPFASRAYFKPRGYAGDYEMMNHLYRDELVGKTLFDQCMHKYFVEESAGAAVKNRGYYLYEKISGLFASTPADQPLKILSVASGPAMEQQIFLKEAPQYHNRPAEFNCLDSDEESLKHAQRQLLTAKNKIQPAYEYKFKNMAIRNVIARGLPDDGYDLVYSAGLFDYFTDQVARAAANKFITAVKPGGTVIIGNYSKNNLSASFMELLLDWHLIYRSEEDLLRIFQGLGSKITIEREPLGINLFVVIQK